MSSTVEQSEARGGPPVVNGFHFVPGLLLHEAMRATNEAQDFVSKVCWPRHGHSMLPAAKLTGRYDARYVRKLT